MPYLLSALSDPDLIKMSSQSCTHGIGGSRVQTAETGRIKLGYIRLVFRFILRMKKLRRIRVKYCSIDFVSPTHRETTRFSTSLSSSNR